jgi:4-amino-4-deoxy-L-arabinose transferase-like glycosyltransferase
MSSTVAVPRDRASRLERAVTWERGALAALLGGTFLLYVWQLASEGWANTYYAAAVQAGTQSWSAFFFGSLDSANAITVDKPPLSLWLMGLSARVFGLNSWSLLLPQAIAGVLTVFVTYRIVRRWFGAGASLLAGTALALTPVAALIFRYNNPDAVLTLLLVLGAYAMVRALEAGSTRWLLAAGALVGCAFLAKSLQAYLVLPPFALVWLVAAPGGIGRRLWQLAAGAGALVLASGWWVAAVELTPAGSRPYIGGSSNNSVLDLIFGYNGLDRLSASGTGPGGGGGGGFSGSAGISRLFNDQMGGQIAWLLPLAAAGLAAGLWSRRGTPRTDRRRAAYLLWGGWALVHALVFSFMTGIVHSYYTVAMAPAVAALVGMGTVDLWRLRDDPRTRWALPAAIAATGLTAYVLLDRTPDFLPWLRWVVLLGALAAAAVLLIGTARLSRRAALAAAAVGVVALLAGPGAYAVQTAGQTHAGGDPSAGPAIAGAGRFGGGPGGIGATRRMGGGTPPAGTPGPQGGSAGAPGAGVPSPPSGTGAFPSAGAGAPGDAGQANAELVAFLRANRGSSTWIAATTGAGSAAPIQLAAGEPVMAIGGFSGGDPAPTLEHFIQLVREGKVRYFVGGGMGGGFGGGLRGGFGGGHGSASEISTWAQQNGVAVSTSQTGGVTVYDLSGAAG